MVVDIEAETFKNKRTKTVPEKLFIQLEGDYKKGESEVYFFYEGYDSIFYLKYGVIVFEEFNIKEYICKKKANVFNVYKRISWEKYNPNKLLFFTDRDYDKLIGKVEQEVSNINIFETKYYAVENYLGEPDIVIFIVKKFLRSYYNLIEISLLEEKSNSFLCILDSFMQKIAPINAWVAYNRLKYFEGNEDYQLPLQKIKIKSFIDIPSEMTEGYQLTLTKTEEEIREIFKSKAKKFKATEFDEDVIESYLNKMILEPLGFLRGKFLMQLYIYYFADVLDKDVDFNAKCTINPLKDENIFSLLCNCFNSNDYFPEDLKQFLELNYNNIK